MKTGRIYEVYVNGKPVGLVGSTICTLKQRRANGYVKRFGPTVELRLIREVLRHESEDDVAYNFHLKASEAMDIARKKTYVEDGGLNKISPLIQVIGNPVLEAEIGRMGGRIQGPIQGHKNVESGHMEKIRNLPQTKIAQHNAGLIAGSRAVATGQLASVASMGGQIGGSIAGRKNVKSGQIQALGHKNVESGWIQALGRSGVGGHIAVENGQIQTLGRIQGRKNVENGHLASLRTPEHQSAAARASGLKNVENGQIKMLSHIRWHVRRGIINPQCIFCLPTVQL